ncbi:GIDE domain-containing protein [Halorussus salinus]|uniref:GIDE domain-containing protein n=1 Tax=Halorussus salinus TaxID=1364935 RepID=UPI001091F743|nr:GIDE domain-containing protein [Halorussus salinus]
MGTGSTVAGAVGSGLLVFAMLMLFATPILYRGWQNRTKYREYDSLHAESSSEATDGDIVMLSGRLDDASDRVTSPLQSEECVVAFWQVSTCRRYGTFNINVHWSEEGVGIDAGAVVLSGEREEVVLEGISTDQQLTTQDKLGQVAGSKRDSVLGSVPLALEGETFEDEVHPTADWPREYADLGAKVGVQNDDSRSQGALGRLLRKVRTPTGTVRFRESVMRAGDSLTVVGRVVGGRDKRVTVEGTDAVDPVVTRASPSELRAKHRRAYRTRLYAVPLVLLAFASLVGYAVYL